MLAAFLALCCLAGWSATAAPITWSVPVTDSADTDVSTNGVLLAAYSFYNGGGTLNGVTFANSGGTSFGGNLMLSPNSAQYPGGGGGGNLSPAYQTLLANGLWSYPGGFTITLSNLLVGKEYEVQFWGDGSVGNNAGYTDILNGGGNTVQVSLNTTGGASGVGQYTIGTFVADATSQTFTVNGNWGNSGQINAMQWRFLGTPAGGITWAVPVTDSADTDVSTNGSLLAAYSFYNGGTTLNGVTFASSGGTSFGSYLSLYANSAQYAGGGGGGSLSSAYQTLLSNGLWSYPGGFTITLNNLTAGHQYQVQLWGDGSPGNGAGYTDIVSGGGNTVQVSVNTTGGAGGVGQYTIGTFMAKVTSQTFYVNGNWGSAQINAIQLRDLWGVSTAGYWNGLHGGAWDLNSTANWSTNRNNAPLDPATFSQAMSLNDNIAYFADNYYASGAAYPVAQNSVMVAAGGVSAATVNFQSATVNYTVSGADSVGITGATALNQNGASTLTLAGVNTYTGPTAINDGTLQIGGAGELGGGNYSGRIVNNGVFKYNSSAVQTLSGVISGTGSLTVNSGTLALAATNTYTGSTTINAGTLELQISGELGGGNYSGRIANNGVFSYDSSAVQTLSGVISGTGSLTVNSGTLALAGVNTYTGPMAINDSMLQITGAGELGGGNYSGRIVNNGVFSYDSSAVQTLSGVISGTGSLSVNSGSLALVATNTYTGSTTINAGRLELQTNGTGGSGLLGFGNYFGPITMNGTYNSIFSYNGTAAQTLAGPITGGGSLIQNGPGPLILSGTNSFNGSIIINQSYLVIVSPSAFGLPVRLSLNNGAVLDVSGINAFSVGNQTLLACDGSGADGSSTPPQIMGAPGGAINLNCPISFNIKGANPCLVVSQGSLVLNSSIFIVNRPAPLANGTYTLVQVAHGSIATNGNLSVGGNAIGSGQSAQITVSGTNLLLVIQNSANTNINTEYVSWIDIWYDHSAGWWSPAIAAEGATSFMGQFGSIDWLNDTYVEATLNTMRAAGITGIIGDLTNGYWPWAYRLQHVQSLALARGMNACVAIGAGDIGDIEAVCGDIWTNLAGPSAPYGGTYLIKDGKPVIVCYMADRDFIPVLNSTGPNRSKFTLEPGADYNSGLGGQWGWQLLPNIGSVPSVTNAMFVTPSVKWPASDPWVRATKSQAWLDYNFGVAQQSAPPFIVIGMFDDVTEDNGWVPCDTTLCTNRAVDYGNRTQDHDITGAISTNSLYNRVCQWIQGAPTYIPGGIIGDGVYIITNSYSKQCVCSPNLQQSGTNFAGLQALQWTPAGNFDEYFMFYHLGNNVYRIISLDSGLALASPNLTSGAQIIQDWESTSALQRWVLTATNGGAIIQNQGSGYVLDVGSTKTSGTPVTQTGFAGNPSQKWLFGLVTKVGTTGVPPVLASPASLTATGSNSMVYLNWSATAGATSFHVKQAMVSGGPYTVVASLTGTNCWVSGLANGTTYYFVVSALNDGGESANAAEVSATPQFTTNLWLPSALGSNLVNWYDAADTNTLWQNTAGTTAVTGNGQAVLRWDDKSTKGNDLTGSSGPTYSTGVMNSLPVVRCNGNALANGAPSMGKAADNFTVIGVFKVASNNGWDNWIIWGNGSGDLDVYVDSAARTTTPVQAMEFAYNGGTGAATTNAVTSQPAFLFMGGVNQATSPKLFSIWKDGAFQQAQSPTIVTAPNSSLTHFRIGPAGSSQLPHGDIAELIVVNTGTNTLSVADRQRLEGYLANKWWGAGSSNPLPAGHPFKSNVPLIVPPTPVMPTQGVSVTGGVVSLTFPTVAGYQYRVDYKNALTDATWQAVAPGFVTSTNGANLTVSDAGAPAQGSRFYRVEAASP